MSHEEYMMQAIEYAREHNPKWPFAAILVDNNTGEVVARAANQSHISPTKHAETAVIDEYCGKFHDPASGTLPDLSQLTLYTTGECCPMCQSAAYWSNIKTVVYGSTIPFLHDLWPNQIDISSAEIVSKCPEGYRREVTLTGPILQANCDELFQHGKALQEREQRAPASQKKESGSLFERYGLFALGVAVAATAFVFSSRSDTSPSP